MAEHTGKIGLADLGIPSGEESTAVEPPAPPAGFEYVMVYRCKYDHWGDFCDWKTTDYTEIDEHEDQLEPGHLVSGEVEKVTKDEVGRG